MLCGRYKFVEKMHGGLELEKTEKCDMRASVTLLRPRDSTRMGALLGQQGESTWRALWFLSPIFAGTMDSTVRPLCDTNHPPVHHIARLCASASFCPCSLVFHPYVSVVLGSTLVVLSSAPTCLLCSYVSVVWRSAPVVLLCSASTCLLSSPRHWAGDTSRVIRPPIIQLQPGMDTN